MDFLLSFRPFQKLHSIELPSKITIKTKSFWRLTALEKILLLSVDNRTWMLVQIIGIILRFATSTFTLTFFYKKKKWEYYDAVNTVLDLLFLVDLIFAIWYRVKWPNKKRIITEYSSNLSKLAWRNSVYKPRPIWMLIVDLASLLPFEFIVRHVALHNEILYSITHLTAAVRIYWVFVYSSNSFLQTTVPKHVVFELVLKYLVFWLILSHTTVCFWRWFIFDHNSKYIENLKKSKYFDANRPISWYWMIFYFSQIGLLNIGFGDMSSTTDGEKVVVTVFVIVGFIFLNGFLISSLSNVLTEKIRRVTILRFRISLMEKELHHSRAPPELVLKVNKFYHSLWNARKGVGPVNEMLLTLPESIWGQVYYDIFKNALNASLLFRSCDEISKRVVSKIMQVALYMAGDVILKRNEINSTLYYIRKGTVKIMSYQDDETEIMTFGAGSIFGQVALLLSLPAKSEVHAATFCEIHLLNRKDLFSVLFDYPKAKEIIKSVHKNLLLNALADKIKPASGKEPLVPENVLSKSDFYKAPRETSKLPREDICVINTCPYVYEPDTMYLHVWSVIVALLILIISVYYPYCAVYSRQYPVNAEPYIILIDIFLIFNLYISFSTAYLRENVLFSNFREILSRKLAKFSTVVDVISLMPLHYWIDNARREKPIVLTLRCLQLYKLHFLFGKAESSVDLKFVGLLRLFKYVLYFFFVGYVVGMFYYMQACYTEHCASDSWYIHSEIKPEASSPIWVSLYFAILVMSATGYGDIIASSERDMICAVICCIGGVFFFIYLISEYSANLSLSKEPRLNFIELADMVNSFLKNHKMLPSETLRVRQYLNLQWERNKGYEFTSNNNLFHDTPQHLQLEINQFTKSRPLQNLRIFRGINEGILMQILSHCVRKVFPPHEVVIYAGDVCNSFVVIEEGYCEVTYGRDVTQKKIICGGDDIGTMELFLGITSLCHVRTITHCSVLKVPINILKRALAHDQMAEKELMESIAEFQESPIIQEIKQKGPVRLHLTVRSSAQKSVFRFNFIRKKKRNAELRDPFLKLGLCQWIRFLLGRMTLLPYGKFLKAWELSRCFFAFLTAMIFPLLPYFELEAKFLYYVGYVLDTTAWVDLYFRLHVCYYNHKNILVSHPLSTASHYIKGSFVLDFIFCFPFDRIMYRTVYDSSGYTLVTSRPIDILRLFRVGQVYRIPTTVINLGVDVLSTPSFFSVMMMMTALTLVFLNFLTSAVLLMFVNYKANKAGEYLIVIEPHVKKHFLDTQKQYNFTTDPFILYLVNFYWVSETSFAIGFGDITAGSKELMIFIIFVIVVSYLYFNYVTIMIASYLSSINVNLTLFQKRMSQLIKYLKAENIEHLLRKHTINHFEYIWKINRGMMAHSVFANFNISLKNDIMIHLYEETLKGVTAFSQMDSLFSRLLSFELQEINLQAGAAIYKKGDIISDIYIIHQGEVTLVGKDENDTIVLGPKKLFGLLSNCRGIIVKRSAVATKNVTVLTIKTKDLYKILHHIQGKNPEEQAKFRKFLIESSKEDDDGQQKKFELSNKQNWFAQMMYKYSNYIMVISVILTLFSVNQVTYTLAFQGCSTALICIIVIVEILFLIKIVISFTVGYINERGDYISSRRLLAKRYLRTVGFYVDVFTLIPFEVFAFAGPRKERLLIISWLRITKLLRMYHIKTFFNLKLDVLNVNMVLLRTIAVAVGTGTLIHQCTCLWFLVSCYTAVCPDSYTWYLTYSGDFQNAYISSIYFVVVVLTTTGFGDAVPHTLLEIIAVDFLMFVAFFYTAIFIGQILSTTQKTLYAKTNFDFEVDGMKTYCQVNDVPNDTKKLIFRYVRNLWENEKGTQIPEMLKSAPSYIVHEIKNSTYGHHINHNPAFKTCNPFFKRQLIYKLYRTVYFYGDIIVYEGEANRTVYFVHRGLVEGKSTGNNQHSKVFESGTYFGLKQGMGFKEPHKMTYTALCYTIILSLQLKHWKFLSEFFPVDVRCLKKRVETGDWD